MLPTDCKKTLLPFLCPLFSGCAPSVLCSLFHSCGSGAARRPGRGSWRAEAWLLACAEGWSGSCRARRAGAGAAARAGLAAVAGGPQRAEVLRGAGERVPRERGLAAGSERDGGRATGLASR